MRGLLGFLLLASGAGCQQIFGLDAPSRIVGTDAGNESDAATDAQPDAPVVLPSIELLTVVTSGVDASTFTFNAVPIGTPGDRVLIVIAHGRNPNVAFGAASLTVNGNPATKRIAVNESDGAATTALFTYRAPSGTSASMVLSYTAGAGDRRVALGVWAAHGLTSELPLETVAVSTVSTNPVQALVQVPVGGFAIAGVSMSAVIAGAASTWSGVPEAYEENVESSIFTSGSSVTPSAGGPLTILHSSTDTTTSEHMVVATFR